MGHIVTVETPVGEIVSRFNGQSDYPGLEIRLVTKDDPKGVVLAVAEWDKAGQTLNVMHWKTLVNDDSEPSVAKFTVAKALRQLAQNA